MSFAVSIIQENHSLKESDNQKRSFSKWVVADAVSYMNKIYVPQRDIQQTILIWNIPELPLPFLKHFANV